MRLVTLAVALLLSLTAVAQNGPCTERAIKSQAETYSDASTWVDGFYFFSGALDKPVVGKAAYDAAFKPVSAERKNEKYGENRTDKIVASPSGDMAYEYGTSHIAFDANGKHEDFTAAYLRVWKAVGGKCKVAAMMAQPEGER